MKRMFLLAALALPAWTEGPALAQRPPIESLSIKDLGLGMPRKPETPFEPDWSVEAGALFLHRSGSSSVVLATTNIPEEGDVRNASDLGFSFEWGPYVSLSRRMFNVLRAEILYFGVYDWRAASSVENPAGITTDVFDAGGAVFDRLDVGYSSRLDNLEFNTLFPLGGKLNWLVGVRWSVLEERSTTLWDGRDNGLGSGNDFASAAAWADNQLYGVQLGIDGTLWQPASRFRVDGLVKACVYTNRMSAGRDVTGTIEAFASDRRKSTRMAFLAELGLMGRFELTQHFILGAGYHVAWLDGVASGFSPLGGQRLSTVLFHGMRATIEARW